MREIFISIYLFIFFPFLRVTHDTRGASPLVARTYDTITQTASNNLKPLLSAFRSFTEDTSTSRFFAEPRPTSERYCSALSSLPDFFNVAVLIPTDTSTISLRRSDASALIFAGFFFPFCQNNVCLEFGKQIIKAETKQKNVSSSTPN